MNRIEDLNQQILDSQEVLQSKADELELERKNVLNLVEVTSAYIKELEGSIEEYKVKLQCLQENSKNTTDVSKMTEGARGTPRPPPEGSSEVDATSNDVTDGLSLSRPSAPAESAMVSEQFEDMKHLQSILSIKVMSMESEISDMKEKHRDEVSTLQKDLDQAKSRLAESNKRRKHSESFDQDRDDDEEYIEELLNKIDALEEELEQQSEK